MRHSLNIIHFRTMLCCSSYEFWGSVAIVSMHVMDPVATLIIILNLLKNIVNLGREDYFVDMMSTNPVCHSAIHAFCQQKYLDERVICVQQEVKKNSLGIHLHYTQVKVHKN